MTLIKDLIHIPEQVQQGDFVLDLSAGLEGDAAQRTLDEYVVTQQLAGCFENALAFIRSALEDTNQRSKGAYLHGSFGSGKSHFMAVLHLLLQGHPQARAITELAPSVSKHDGWMQQKNILLVPYHMIGAASVEAGVLGGYARYVARRHPEAPVPGFYQSDRLFSDATGLRESFGNEAFFNKLNEAVGSTSDDDGWGELASGWDAESFDAVLSGSAGDQDRARLVGDLISVFFSTVQDMTASDGKGFVSFDDGLAILIEHAKALGYDAVILFLDELILWLASNLSNTDFINREIQKIVKLVESGSARSLPLISLIARQRDLKDFIGDSMMGVEQAQLGDALKHWEGRFHTIQLADGNLPSIAERRLLAPIDDAAKLQIDQAFASTTDVRTEIFNILLTRSGDRDQFRKLYPFSPAAIDALVALSSALQRERTALKVMLLLLVRHRDTLSIGQLIPVGDVYDVIAEEATPFSDSMRQHFESAQRLLKTKFIPLLQSEHGIEYPEPESADLSDTKTLAFYNDLRLMKTLLLSALVPEVECFQQLSPEKIAALNHGTIKSPIPGREGHAVLSKFGKWASQVGEIRLVDDGNTNIISLQLLSVDTQAILESANNVDTLGNRQRVIKEMVCNAIGITLESDLFQQHSIEWRGSKRDVEVRFCNIREIEDFGQFANRDDEWKILIDFPIDSGTHSPTDDQGKINEFAQTGENARTICWLPAFLNDTMRKHLGTLVRLEHILRNDDSYNQYTTSLSPQDRHSARQLLDNQRSQLCTQLQRVLLAAYGVAAADADTLEYEGLVEPLRSLQDGFTPNLPVGSNLREAFVQVMDQALRYQYPAHPQFPQMIKSADIGKMLVEIDKAVRAENGRIDVDQPVRRIMKEIAEPLELGVMHERHFIFSENWPSRLQRVLASNDLSVTVGNLRTCMNTDQPMGLSAELENCLILVFALHGQYAFTDSAGAIDSPGHKSLDDNWTLIKEDLVDSSKWLVARENASAVFGVTTSNYLTASNQQFMVEKIKEELNRNKDGIRKLVDSIERSHTKLGIDSGTITNRLGNANAAVEVLDQLVKLDGAPFVAAVADLQFVSDAQALGTSITSADAVCLTLDEFNWQLLAHVVEKFGESGRAVAQSVADGLRLDQRVLPIQNALQEANRQSTTLLTSSRNEPEPASPAAVGSPASPAGSPTDPIGGAVVLISKKQVSVSRSEAAALLKQASDELAASDAERISIEITLTRG